jgi:hypothetical protein
VKPESVSRRQGRPARLDQLLADEGLQRCAQGDTVLLSAKLGERAAPELLADHRSVLENRALVGVEAVEPGSEEGLDRWRHRDLSFGRLVGAHRDQLLDEERIPGSSLDDPRALLRVQVGAAGEPGEKRVGFGFRQRVEQER